MEFTWHLVIANFEDISLICDRENKLPPTKIQQKLILFLHCWTSRKLVANSLTKTTIWSPFLLLSNVVHESFSHVLGLKFKLAIFFPAKPEKSKIREIKLPQKISRHSVNCERVCFSCNLSAFVSQFQQSRVRELRKFFGQKSHRPPPPLVINFSNLQ